MDGKVEPVAQDKLAIMISFRTFSNSIRTAGWAAIAGFTGIMGVISGIAALSNPLLIAPALSVFAVSTLFTMELADRLRLPLRRSLKKNGYVVKTHDAITGASDWGKIFSGLASEAQSPATRLFIYFGHGNMKDGTSTIVYRNAGITDKEFLEQVNALAGTNIAFISACGAGGFVSLAEKGAKENIAIATTSKNQDTGDAAGHSMLSLLRQCVRKKTHVADFFQRHPGIRAREPAFYCGKTAAKAFL